MPNSRLAVAVVLVTFVACGKSPTDGLSVGGLYSVKVGPKFQIAKILSLDGGTVHVRLYKNTFPTRPQSVDPSQLSLGKITDKDGFGMGHLPLDRAAFDAWDPKFIMETKVAESELDGYRAWKESGGGSFK